MSNTSPNALIAKAIQRERERAGRSLSALAAAAGLAKSTLSQLEAGQGNPSVETLWAIATALDVPFSYLFENPTPETTVIRAREGAVLSSDRAAFTGTPLAECPPGQRRDLYRLDIRSGSVREAKAHPSGTVEHVFVAKGRVRVGPVGAIEDLGVGDYYRYPGDVAHSYEALTETATLLLVMESR